MIVRLCAAAALMMMATASPAVATATIDQSNVVTFLGAPNTIGASGLNSRPNQPNTQRWQTQTIVAGLTGKLTAIDLQAYADSDRGDLLVTLGTGEITTAGYSTIGTITVLHSALASQAAIGSGGFTTVDLSALNYYVTAGQTFTIVLSVSAPVPGNNFGNFAAWTFGELNQTGDIVNQPNYAPGVARFSTDSGQTWTVAGADRGFRTFVDVAAAVPEPATWGMMILGFGLVGGAQRYRRRTAPVSVGVGAA